MSFVSQIYLLPVKEVDALAIQQKELIRSSYQTCSSTWDFRCFLFKLYCDRSVLELIVLKFGVVSDELAVCYSRWINLVTCFRFKRTWIVSDACKY